MVYFLFLFYVIFNVSQQKNFEVDGQSVSLEIFDSADTNPLRDAVRFSLISTLLSTSSIPVDTELPLLHAGLLGQYPLHVQ